MSNTKIELIGEDEHHYEVNIDLNGWGRPHLTIICRDKSSLRIMRDYLRDIINGIPEWSIENNRPGIWHQTPPDIRQAIDVALKLKAFW